MRELKPLLGFDADPWTAKAKLPGGDFAGTIEGFVAACQARWSFDVQARTVSAASK